MINIILSSIIALAVSLGGWVGVQQATNNSVPVLGTRVLTVPQGGTGAATLTGCLEGNGTGAITGTGSACGSGSGGAFSWTVNSNYNSTSTTLGFLNGFFTTASSTLSGDVYLPALTQGFLYTGSNGLTQTIASSSIQNSWFNNDAGYITSSSLHDAVTLAGEDYLSLSTQQITANAINPDNLANADFGDFSCNGTNCSLDATYLTSYTSPYEIATGTIAVSNLAFFGKTSGRTTLEGVATTTLTASSPLSLSNPVAKVGGSNSVLTLDTSGSWTGSAGSVANALTAGNGLSSAGTYNGATARTFSIDNAYANSWSVNQTFNYSSSTVYSSFVTASSTNWYGGGLTTCNSGNFLQWTSGFFSCGTPSGSGTVTSVVAGVGFHNRGLDITSSGTLNVGIATSTTPTIGNLAMWTGAGDASNGATIGSISTSTLVNNIFPWQSYGASTSTIFGFTGGLFSTASSTFSSNLYLTGLNSTQGVLYTGSLGNVRTVATTTTTCTNQFARTVSAFGVATCATVSASDVSLANLTATNSTLTFSGTYNGATARTIGLNLGNANTWTARQTFNYSSSTIYSSFVNASTTNLFVGTGQGIAYVGSGGRLGVTATSTFSLSQFTNDLASLTAGTGLTSAGTYNGATARTFSLDTANANSWTGLQTFLNASSTLFSARQAYFGGSATTTIDTSGNVVIPSGSNLTITGKSDGCATFASGVLNSTGSACGSGGGGTGQYWASSSPYSTHVITYPTDTASDIVFGRNSTTTAPMWFDVSATTTYLGNGGTGGDSDIVLGQDSYEWTVGYDITDHSFAIASGTALGTNNAFAIAKSTLAITLAGNLTIAGQLAGVSSIDTTTENTIESALDTLTGLTTATVATTLTIPASTSCDSNADGEICQDTSDNQLIVDGNVVQTQGIKIAGRTIASTSPAFIAGGLMPLTTQLDGFTITRIQCHVTSGTSKVIAIEDASANSSEDITCGTTNTTDDGSITNATYTASELIYIDFGATTGSVDYVSISIFGTWTRE